MKQKIVRLVKRGPAGLAVTTEKAHHGRGCFPHIFLYSTQLHVLLTLHDQLYFFKASYSIYGVLMVIIMMITMVALHYGEVKKLGQKQSTFTNHFSVEFGPKFTKFGTELPQEAMDLAMS